MFLVNSRHPLFTATLLRFHQRVTIQKRALLIPKIRSYFAEFLSQNSLVRLRILFLPTCVGLRYGPIYIYLEAFLDSRESTTSELTLTASYLVLYDMRICLHITLLTCTAYSNRQIVYPTVSLHRAVY